jgi:hypothetical protein
LSHTLLALARRDVEVGTEDLDGVDLALEPPPHVEGTLVFESGCAPETAQITLSGDNDYVLHVGMDGRFVLQSVWPGRYKLSVYGERRDTVMTFAKLGDAEIPTDGFDLTSETKGPLRIAMRCAGR